jgi:peptidoglycan hydrolase-like protein with peptidoglycan-binding domain
MRRSILAGAAALVALAGAVGWAALAGGAGRDDKAEARRPTNTAAVTRRDLVARDTFAGRLGYADRRELTSPLGGTVTWLPREGATVRRGGVLLRIDGRPLVLLYGSTPLWRTLAEGVEGEDVAQLQRNLVALGYDPAGEIDLDGEFDDATEDSVLRWQDDLGVTEDGSVGTDEVVFLPGARRIGTVSTSLGARIATGASALETTSLRRVVSVDLDARRQTLVREGQSVRVELPNGRTVAGRITEVGRVAKDAEGEDGTPTVTVTIALPNARTRGSLDQAPVDVAIAREVRRDALAVPVTALLALAGGGYAVELVDGATTKLVRVQPGLFADGLVEIEGEGIEVGGEVVVPE